MAEALLQLANLSKFYKSAQSIVVGVDSVDLSFSRGEFVAVTGESGSGKTTLASVIGGMLPYESGEMFYDGKPTSHYGGLDWERYRRDNIAFISQNYGIIPGATVMKNVESALIISGMERRDAKDVAYDILRRVDLLELKNRRAARLSSGQKQRLSIARALAKPAPVLIADEPTGNLDSENSAKIIKLLADAAKDRLVILVTHEFDEAKDLATRHIIIQNGRVALDTPLRQAPVTVPAHASGKKKRRALSFYVAGLQCASRPVWSVMTALFFAVTAFAVFVFLGVFVQSLDDTATRIYDDSAFKNGDPTRIIVSGAANGELTEEDFEAMRKIPHVKSVERWGGIADIRYAYIKDVNPMKRGEIFAEFFDAKAVGFDLVDHEVIIGNPYMSPFAIQYMEKLIVMQPDASFAKTVPLISGDEDFLSSGRLPENIHEVVAGDSNLRIGDRVEIYFADSRLINAFNIQYIKSKFVVVGLTDYDRGIYMHDDMGRLFRSNFNTSIYGVQGSSDPAYMVNTFEPSDAGSDEACVTIYSYDQTDKVLDSLDKAGYYAVSVFRIGAGDKDPDLAAERIQTLLVCLISLIIVSALEVFVLRAMFSAENETYRLLGNIGLTGRTAKRSVIVQVAFFTLLGELVGAAGIYYCGTAFDEKHIVKLMNYLMPWQVLLLVAVHMALSAIAAWRIISVLGRQVYPLGSPHRDLDLGDDGDGL